MQLSFFYMPPSILLSGFIFPFRGMPDWTQAIGQTIPVTHFLRVVRGALLKGEGLATLWPSLVALRIFVCIGIALAMLRYRRTLDWRTLGGFGCAVGVKPHLVRRCKFA
jgi:ABC-2 type transport system permease protein